MLPLPLLSLLLSLSLSPPASATPALNARSAPVDIQLRSAHVEGTGLQKRSTSDLKAHYRGVAASMRGRYGYAKPSNISLLKRDTVAIPITNQMRDSSYFGQVSIGTPPQDFSVILDTGSTDLWVTDTSCRTCGADGSPLYDPARSSTANIGTEESQIRYGSGAVAGTISTDTISLGGLAVERQTFLAVDQTTTDLLNAPVSGILGLAFSTLSSTQSVPIWENLLRSNRLTTSEMGFYLTRQRGQRRAPDLSFGGVFTLGGVNNTLFTGEIEFLDLSNADRPSFWLLPLTSLRVNGQSVNLDSRTALSAIDTGTTLVGGPTGSVRAFWGQVQGSQTVSDMPGFYSFPCDTTLSVDMSYGGKSWPINPIDMNLGSLDALDTRCLGGIFDLTQGSSISPGNGNPSWVVGDVFLKNVYSVYRADPPSIGFAQLSDAAGGSAPGIPPSSSSPPSSPLNPTAATASSSPSSPTNRPGPIPSITIPTGTPTEGTPSSGNNGNGNAALSTRHSSSLILLGIVGSVMLLL